MATIPESPTSGHVAHIPVVAPKKGTRNDDSVPGGPRCGIGAQLRQGIAGIASPSDIDVLRVGHDVGWGHERSPMCAWKCEPASAPLSC